MLFGSYDHNVDKKGRVAIPAKFRSDLGESFMLCRSIFGKRCLCVYSLEQWQNFVAKIAQLPSSKTSDAKRFLYDGAFNVEFDAQGRILVPALLRDYAQLGSEAHIIGMDTNIEIWDSENWKAENERYTPESVASIFEGLDF